MSKTVNAGIVTAYGAAVRGGYEGTYAQFCADLAQLSQVLEEFLGFSVTVETLAAGASATASYDDGVLALGIPRGNTGNGIQSIVLNADYTLTVTYTNGNTWTSGSIRGQVGATPHLTIGTVQTLEPGQSATAEITGTDEDPVLNLGIPKGQAGASDAGGVSYDPEGSYNEGTVGAELQEQNRQLSDKADINLGVTGASVGQIIQIASVDSNGKPTSWKAVNESLSLRTAQDIKRALNNGRDLTNYLGAQISCKRGTETLVWDIVDYDATIGTVTLLLHDGWEAIMLEPGQALIWFENGLAAGDYKVSNESTVLYFSITQAIPNGGQLRIPNNTSFQTFASQADATTLETGSVSTTEIQDAVSLDSYIKNDWSNQTRGRSVFGESALLTVLNSTSPEGTPFNGCTRFSRPIVNGSVSGFMYQLDEEFIDTLDDAVWGCGSPQFGTIPSSMGGIAKSSTPYTITSKFAIAARTELGGSPFNGEGTVWGLYNGATNTERIKYTGTTAINWWTRTPFSTSGDLCTCCVNSGGFNTNFLSTETNKYVVPCCKISKD